MKWIQTAARRPEWITYVAGHELLKRLQRLKEPSDLIHPIPRAWSMAMRAADEVVPANALDELLQIYWQPLYEHARLLGLSLQDTKDGVQSLCESRIRRSALRTADPGNGRLRSFLLAGLCRGVFPTRGVTAAAGSETFSPPLGDASAIRGPRRTARQSWW
jgi:hypothetical protein